MINPGMFGYDTSQSSHSAATASARAAGQARGAKRDVAYLEERVERLSLVCMAMWSLLQDKTNLTEEDLLARVKVLDMMDGTEDNRASRTVQKCQACGRTMSPRHRKCLYCGEKRLVQSAFDAV